MNDDPVYMDFTFDAKRVRQGSLGARRYCACPRDFALATPSNLVGVFVAFFLIWCLSALGQQPTPILPDPKLTPGDVFDVTIQDICTPGYSRKVRAVTAKLKRQAYAEYGVTSWEPGDYEVDHLIPLSLGGSNSIRNLWPQSTGVFFGVDLPVKNINKNNSQE